VLGEWGVLSPSFTFASAIAAVLLVALLVVLGAHALRKDRQGYRRFKQYRSTVRRQKAYRKWLVESFLVFGGAALASLLLVWQYIPLLLADVETLPLMKWIRGMLESGGALLLGLILGATVVVGVGAVLAIYFARRDGEVPAIGDIAALLPRNRAELRYGTLLSLNAGVVEELLFRLAVPALGYAATGNAVLAIWGSMLLFSVLHLYQGVWGVIGAAVIGSLLMALFLLTGNILVPIVAHVLIDLRTLVLIPMMVYGVHKPANSTIPNPQKVI
jgi:membrane protease YdiL (CAAX protease family)